LLALDFAKLAYFIIFNLCKSMLDIHLPR
jgi:hypothetical protein